MSLRPVVLLIEPHEEHLERGRAFLINDCSRSFDVRSATSIAAAREILERAQKENQPVALALVRHFRDEEELNGVG